MGSAAPTLHTAPVCEAWLTGSRRSAASSASRVHTQRAHASSRRYRLGDLRDRPRRPDTLPWFARIDPPVAAVHRQHRLEAKPAVAAEREHEPFALSVRRVAEGDVVSPDRVPAAPLPGLSDRPAKAAVPQDPDLDTGLERSGWAE